MPPASLQTFIDTPNCVLEDRVQYSTVHIPNTFCDGHLQIINCVGIVLYCNSQMHRDFLIALYLSRVFYNYVFRILLQIRFISPTVDLTGNT